MCERWHRTIYIHSQINMKHEQDVVRLHIYYIHSCKTSESVKQLTLLKWGGGRWMDIIGWQPKIG